MLYELCAKCSHFVELDTVDWPPRPGYVHLDDGEAEYDHDATPSGHRKVLDSWKHDRPDLFETYADGKIGPNSAFGPRQ